MAKNASLIPQNAVGTRLQQRHSTVRAKISIIIAKRMEPTSAIPS
jgi:hypothetical protein